jgi:4-amino-4-deoxy-L-arabinose transferase-like glycosyltransferase
MDYRRRVLVFLLLVCAVKLALAFYLELGNDEAYYWTYSRHLQWNYFDHPPGVAVWIRIFTANLSLENYGGFIRLGSVVGSALAAWFLYRTVVALHSERAGWFAVVLYHASFYAGITAGLYILPDSPQMVFWTASLYMIARLMKDGGWRNWMLFGISTGLCIMCKVHGVFLWVGMGGYVVFYRRAWLVQPYLYVSLLITMIIISPIFFWNLHYDFITYRFHSSRVTIDHFALLWKSFLRELGSQVTINNPVTAGLIVATFIARARKKLPSIPALKVYDLIGLPLAFLLLFISLFRSTTLPHWSGPAYVSLLPMVAIGLAQRSVNNWPKILRAAFVLFVLVALAGVCILQFYPGTWGDRSNEKLGRDDVTLDMHGWRDAGMQFAAIYNKEVAEGRTPPGTPLVASHWGGAHVEYYFARPLNVPLIGLGQPQQLNHYLWTNRWNISHVNLAQAYCIIPSDGFYRPPSGYFQSTEKIATIQIDRNGKPAHYFFVYRLKGLIRPVPQIDDDHSSFPHYP